MMGNPSVESGARAVAPREAAPPHRVVPQSRTDERRGDLVFWQFWQWVPGALISAAFMPIRFAASTSGHRRSRKRRKQLTTPAATCLQRGKIHTCAGVRLSEHDRFRHP
jgi:hypothetical protein